ncbi:hypothetical protein ACFW6K_34960 [Streptomyces sp. NPDC058733]|uniref:hypothetical protein n=1 Tax=unclassified Streptomyces TaxID=2593676 RepID=UPI00368799D8
MDLLAQLRRRFDYPTGFDDARRTLAQFHTVLVDGDPGNGRSAAARILLFEYRDLRSTLREVAAEDDEGDVRLDTRTHDEPEGLLLDLSDADLDTWHALHDDLPGLHHSVRTSRSRLVVVLPARLPASALHPDLARLRAVISRPDARLVLRGAFLDAGFEGVRELPEDVEHFLGRIPPLQQVVRLAWLVRTEAAAGRSPRFADWCRAAVEVLTRRPEDVARHVVGLKGGRPRALLLATAMLHGARSDAVYEACEALLATVEHPADERPLLDREDLSARFTEIKATHDRQGRVTFAETDYDIAIRTHFWNHMPGLRAQLATWVGRAVALDSLAPTDRALLAERFTEQTLRTSGPHHLLGLVRKWADHTDPRVRPAAAHALAYGSLHPEHGRAFRRELLMWGTSSLSAARAEVLTAACSGEFASRFPEQAMVRLHHVARHPRYGGEAERRLIDLVVGDHRLHRRMLERLARGLAKALSTDVRLFTVLASPRHLTVLRTGTQARPHALLDERGVRAGLIDCWAALFGNVPLAEWHDLPHQWFAAAGHVAPHRRDQLLDILVSGCRGQPLHLARLYQLAFHHRVAPLLRHKVDAAQGLRSSRP